MLTTEKSIQNVDTFLDIIKQIVAPHAGKPLAGSQAERELKQNINLGIQLRVTYSQYWLLLETACDHAAALPKLYQEPAVSIAPWSCVRGVLEAACVATWLADPSITAQKRIARSYSRRYDELIQQSHFIQSINEADTGSQINSRIKHLTEEAQKCGFDIPKDRKRGQQIGIALIFPSVTKLVKDHLGQETDYRLLSAFAHAETWAVHQGGFRNLPNESVIKVENYDLESSKIQKFIHPEAVNYLCWTSIAAIGHMLMNGLKLFGGDVDTLCSALDHRYCATNVAKWHRTFWR